MDGVQLQLPHELIGLKPLWGCKVLKFDGGADGPAAAGSCTA
jgi:hypothetical protein